MVATAECVAQNVVRAVQTALMAAEEAATREMKKLSEQANFHMETIDIKNCQQTKVLQDVTAAKIKHENSEVKEDWVKWTVFTVAFFVLLIFDTLVLHRGHETLSFTR